MIKNVFFIAILLCESISLVQVKECNMNVDHALYENCMSESEIFKNDSKMINGTHGDFGRALSTMNFYRKKYNEYLCSNFVSNEILQSFVERSQPQQRRIGKGIENDENALFSGNETSNMDDKSTFFKNSRLNELQDFAETNAQKSFNNYRKMDNKPLGYANSRLDEGDITGYAFPITTNYQAYPSATEDDDSIIQETESSPFPKVNGDSILYNNNKNMLKRHRPMQHPNDMFIPSHSEGYFQNELGYRSGSSAEKNNYSIQNHLQNTQLGLKDFIDIALTSLAYLAFGMFVLQVLICISMNKSNKIMLMPMSIDGSNTPEEIRRRKRSPRTRRLLMVDNVSRDIIISINRLLENKECLHGFMCTKKRHNQKQKKKRSSSLFSYNPFENIS